jgi:8-oxo-dGTP pyrophosphatase MutT (NUDIX family)
VPDAARTAPASDQPAAGGEGPAGGEAVVSGEAAVGGEAVVSGEAAVSKEPSASEQAAWFAQLPTMFAAAAALLTDPAGRVLLVKPNYRDHWSLVGGILEHGEPPHVGCRREVAEELGIDIEPGPLLVVGWAGPDGTRPKPIVHFVFDGGVLTDDIPIRLQASELDDYRFVNAGDLADYLPPVISARVAAALRSRGTGAAVYLPWA